MAQDHQAHRHSHRSSPASRLLSGLLALASLFVGSLLALQHPLSSTHALLIFFGMILAAAWRPYQVPFLVPATLPVVALAPLSGWIIFEELDLMILAVAAGAFGRRSLSVGLHRRTTSPSTKLLIWLFSASLMLSLWRGFGDAGELNLNLFQSYYDPLNSLRLAKGFFLALLVSALFSSAYEADHEQAEQRFLSSAVAGLGFAALAVVIERASYSSLLDFSSDYRATGSFWEMHIGGATLDGYLTLGFPLAALAAVSARSIGAQLGAVAVLALTVYAALATFSRGVYLAIPVSLVVLMLATGRSRPIQHADGESAPSPLSMSLLALAFLIAATLAFIGSGYRGLAALLICGGLVLFLGAIGRYFPLPVLRTALIGVPLSVLLVLLSQWIPKGPYLLFGIASTLCAAFIFLALKNTRERIFLSAAHALFASMALAIAVGDHWGDDRGLLGMSGGIAILAGLLFWQMTSARPVWPARTRPLINLSLGAFSLAALVAVFGGGAYMAGRFDTASQDLKSRMAHWNLGAKMLETPLDWAFGKGLGRFPAGYLYSLPDGEFPGGYRLKKIGNEDFVTLTGSRHAMGFGSILRISQHLFSPLPPTLHFSADVRSKHPARLHVEVCEKHLLYTDRCASTQLAVPVTNEGIWQRIQGSLDARQLEAGPWYAKKNLVFSVGADSVAADFDIDNLRLAAKDNGDELINGDFSDGMSRWFFSSDRVHMPWHIKSLFAHVLFDQGVVGLALFLLLTGRACWRLSFGRARHHVMAPALLASLAGFMVVGIFDSLIDAARLNFIFWLLVLTALTLPIHRSRQK